MLGGGARPGAGGRPVAFLDPKGTGGVLVELYQLTPEETERRREKMDEMRRRLREGRRVYAAGIMAFLSGLRAGSNGDSQ